ncbi:GDP-Man:Man(3)GlcNAc(2)-PP-Dol alpha-1,2-mannosyltransferase-like [Tubulanus polymorphus]|uniref:GDP-Man:Man(3)GlcNAc(2)-PP-Dol alpha-1,2-mannosyltransferase-like n=1 Tax=Tubulanus polymorphus TaxID=672921 RepID=UPI003DA52991
MIEDILSILRGNIRILFYMMNLLLLLIVLCVILLVILFALLKFILRKYKLTLHPEIRQSDSTVVVGFFHPYCHAGGGGERVLWTAIRAIQKKYPHVQCVVYTGDHEATGTEILNKARDTFNITIPHPERVHFIFLRQRDWVEAKTYPYFTLLGQSLGSAILGVEALFKYIPDIYIDSMGYAFTLPIFRYLAGCKIACYVHYPTISTDMLDRVIQRQGTYNNASFISQSTILSQGKLLYYRLFAYLYGIVGRCSQVVMVNSTWTRNHILHLWKTADRTNIVYPPCDTTEFVAIPLKDDSASSTTGKLFRVVSVGQFRPEKDHKLQIHAFCKFVRSRDDDRREMFRLVLIGGCRNADDEARVQELRELCRMLDVEENVEFKLNVPFIVLKEELAAATIGLHTMWNEHFGIGVVECMAAGTVVLAHNSGGPKMDIVTDYEGSRTGFLADTEQTYADCMRTIYELTPTERREICSNARESVARFSEEAFENGFLDALENLLRI